MTKTIARRSFLAGSVVAAAHTVFGAVQTPAPASAGAADPKLIDDLVAGYRILAQQGVLDGFGHVSMRHNRAANRFIMSRSLAPELVTANDLIEFDLDGNPVDAKGQSLYSERFIHAEIYRARKDVNAVVHNHAPSLIPFGVTNVPLRPMYHMAPFIGNGVPVFDIRKSFGMTDMLVSDSKKGHALAEVLGDKAAVLMRGHGVAVVGATIPIAVGRSIYLDMDAKIQAQAIALGGSNITYLDPQEAQKMMDAGENRSYERPWQLWKAKAMGK
ncbi:MAG TPA: class II aldolase/adducin family protein [Terriglobia bacterium]|nr:class II aldolase/adducin family protein [Terriglobia bacterium]